MRPPTDVGIDHKGTLGHQRVEMDIDRNNIAHLMTLLTDLYSDPALAVIREYSANALDSHIAAGISDPIEISLPTEMEPTFQVKDYGVGLSVDEVINNFSKYGWSSKRESNDEAGFMGIGCKSALTYTPQFTLTAIKDGVQAIVVVSRGKNGVGGLEVVDTASTAEPNGVTIMVPVGDIRSFNVKAGNFFRYWKPGTVLVDGEQPNPYIGEWLDEQVLMMNTSQTDRDIIVMGNIPYEVDHVNSLTPELRGRAVVWVPMGTVDMTPNREHLQYTPRTRDLCKELRNFIQGKIWRQFQEELDSQPTGRAAMDCLVRWQNILQIDRHEARKQGIRYRGVLMPSSYHGSLRLPRDKCWRYMISRDEASKQVGKNTSTWDMVDKTFIVGHPTQTVTKIQRLKIGQYFQRRNTLPNTPHTAMVYLVNNMGWAWPWLSTGGVDVVSWDEIEMEDVKVERAPKRTPQKVHYDTLTGLGRGQISQEILNERYAKGIKIVFFSPAIIYMGKGNYLKFYSELQDVFARNTDQKYICVAINPQSWDKFRREYPAALSLPQAVIYEANRMLQGRTPLQRAFIFGNERAVDSELEFSRLSADKFDDPDLKAFVKEVNGGARNYQELHNRWRDLRKLRDRAIPHYYGSAYAKGFPAEEVIDRADQVLDRYPLMRVKLLPYSNYDYRRSDRKALVKAIYEYANTLYEARRWANRFPVLVTHSTALAIPVPDPSKVETP